MVFCTIIGDYIIRVNITLYTLRPPLRVYLYYTVIYHFVKKKIKNIKKIKIILDKLLIVAIIEVIYIFFKAIKHTQ